MPDITNSQAWEDLHGVIGDEDVVGQVDLDLVNLTNADAPAMLTLAARNEPGPFLPRTVELGGYLGVRVNGKLVAMAGQHPFLHASAQNFDAIRLYEKLGFKIRTGPNFTILKPNARVNHE